MGTIAPLPEAITVHPMTTTHPDNTPHLQAGMFLGPRIPGYNTDRIDVNAGLNEANTILGGLTPIQELAIGLGLNEWRRGEEDRAGRTLAAYLDQTAAYRVLAVARAAGERNAHAGR